MQRKTCRPGNVKTVPLLKIIIIRKKNVSLHKLEHAIKDIEKTKEHHEMVCLDTACQTYWIPLAIAQLSRCLLPPTCHPAWLHF